MATLPLLHHPHPTLRLKAKPLRDFGAATQRLIDDMFETMYDESGVGLAAPQVGVSVRLMVMDCAAEDSTQPLVFINPELTLLGSPIEMEEGCLSVPGFRDRVKRHEEVRVRAQDRHGVWFELAADGLLSQCIQHENDHLDGKLFIDQLSSLKRERARKAVKQYEIEQQEAKAGTA
jgi:peptide deformylase